MLDNEHPGNLGDEGGERDGAVAPPADAAQTTTPARRTRAPRRKAAAAKDQAPADPAGAEAAAEPGAAIEAASASDAASPAPTRPVKATRSRRKAAAPAVASELAVVSESAAVDPAESAVPSPAEDSSEPVQEPPVKATRSRRKKAAPAVTPDEPLAVASHGTADQPVAEDDSVTEPTADGPAIIGVLPLDADFVEEEPAPRTRNPMPPPVLFMPPDPAESAVPPATRRSRRSAPPAAEVGDVEAAPVSRRGRRAAPAPVEVTADVPAAEETEESPEGARRSRRRRRGATEEPVEAVVATEVDEPVLEEAIDTPDDDDVEDGADEGDDELVAGRRRRRRGRRGRGRGKGPADDDADVEEDAEASDEAESEDDEEADEGDGVTRRRRRRRRKGSGVEAETSSTEDGVHTVVRVREPRRTDEVQGVSGSTRLEAKRQRRRDGREQRRTRPPILSESEFLARREAVDRVMVVRQKADRTQIAVLEDGVLVEHYVARATSGTMVGNVYLGKVQNVLPSMEAAFVDVGRGRNAVLYAGEVNWDATGLEGRARSIEQALRSGDSVLVQVTKDPIGHKGARLTSHIALSGRHLVYVPNGNASGISRKLPDTERKRLRDVLKKLVPDGAGVIVRTAAEGASEDELARDVKRLQAQWEEIQRKAAEGHAPVALSEEPDLVIRVVRDLFNEDFRELVVQGDHAYTEVENYLNSVSPDLVERLHRHTGVGDVFAEKRIDEQILKGLDRKVFLPSGGHLVIDRTEAMTVVDVNTGKYTGAGGNLEETVTRNNLEAAEEIVRQLRLRDLGGIVVIDFIDMVLESNRDLVLRRLTECLGRDRTKHQVTEITSLGLVQMTRKRIGAGLLEAFSETCEHCKGRGVTIHAEPVPEKRPAGAVTQVKAVAAASRTETPPVTRSRRRRGGAAEPEAETVAVSVAESAPVEIDEPVVHDGDDPVAVAAGLPPVTGSGIVTVSRPALSSEPDDDYDISGYDLSRYQTDDDDVTEPLRLTGADDPDAIDDEDDEEPVGAGAGGRRRSRRGARRRTRP